MRVKFTTTIEAKLVEDLKIEAIKKGIASNDILEELLKLRFGGQPEPLSTPAQTEQPLSVLTEEELKDIKNIFHELPDWSWHNAAGYAAEQKRSAKEQGATKKEQDEIYKQSNDRYLELSYYKLHKLKDYLKKAGFIKD